MDKKKQNNKTNKSSRAQTPNGVSRGGSSTRGGSNSRGEVGGGTKSLRSGGILSQNKTKGSSNKAVFDKGRPRAKENVLEGKIDGTSRGFGFLLREGGDIFIPAEALNGARHGDTVAAKIRTEADRRGGRKQIAEVVEIKERGQTLVVGTYYNKGTRSFVVPDSRHFCDIPVSGGASEGDKVVVAFVDRVADFGDNREEGSDKARVVEVLGKSGDAGVDLLSIVRGFGFSEHFPRAVLRNSDEVCNIRQTDFEGREDFRDETVFTIDGEDSRDFDDAVSIRRTAAGFVLKVHIADVAHYVRTGSPLDKEAYSRGTSVYFPFTTIPMLPPALSDEICSLKEGEDRLCLSVVMHINKRGEVTNHRIVESVINSKARLTYNLVQAILDFDGGVVCGENPNCVDNEASETVDCVSANACGANVAARNCATIKTDTSSATNKTDATENAVEGITKADLRKYKHILSPLAAMKELTDILLAKRTSRGAIEFETDEPKITMKGTEVVGMAKAKRLFSHRLIEEFMVLTNEVVARHFEGISAPFVYRVHAAPPPEKIERLTEFLDTVGLAIDYNGDTPTPHDYCRLLAAVPDDLKDAVNQIALRSMTKAEYNPDCKGHFGLSLEHYCHFTSPIRRYPDLLIHRIIKESLHDGNLKKFRATVGQSAIQSSRQERLAEEAEREVNDVLAARFMARFVGDEFDGRVSGITEWGLFVRLENTAEGLVRAESLGGGYTVFGIGAAKVGGVLFRPGQAVRVRVVDVSNDKIEFELV